MTPSPSPTEIAPTPIAVLPVLTAADWWGHDLTPIPTPELDGESYRLKDWSEADALDLIRSLEVYAHENDTLAAAHARLNFPDAYKLVELAVREAIYRYPDTPHRNILDWRLAMAQAIAEESGSDTWVLNQIELALNHKRFSLDDLNAGLAPYGFTLVQQLTAKNLFGHGLESPVFWIRPPDLYGSQGIFFSVQGKTPGNYKVTPIYARWDLNADVGFAETTMQVGDHNGNGIPEVVLETADSSGSICLSDVLVFEWDGTRFVDLTRGKVHSSDCLAWSFGTPNTPQSDTITIDSGIFPPLTETYKWNGTYYALIDQQLTRNELGCQDYTYTLMDGWDDYRSAINHAQSTLTHWPEDAPSLGANCPDYVRFKIAIAYALHDRLNEARSALETLETSSSLSSAVKVFLENYHDTNQLYQSCQAAQIAYEGKEPLCNLSDTFPFLIRSLHDADVSDPMAALQKNGLEIKVFRHIDLDGDGVLDWLVDIDSSTDDVNLWGLLTTGQSLQPIYITGLHNYREEISEQDAFKADIFEMPNTSDHLLIISFDEFKIYRLKRTAENPVVSYLSEYESDVKEYTFHQTDHGLDLELTPDRPGLIDFDRWNAATNQFEKLPLYKNNIFTDGGPSQALPYLEHIAKGLEGLEDQYGYTKPQFIYLLGLAYELTGDKAQASKTYWQLWHDFPQSGYALMARSKIEQSTP